ncbi:MAG: OmpA family protein, partial [Cyclobacteriaceae bacterium]|nr:OmpA family protein [Cyclobacteriaceae bacterium]
NVINTIENELFPFISADNILYFASQGHSGIGGLDIYAVDLTDSSANVVNLGYLINTKDDDFGLILRGNVGYLSSNRTGGIGADDIYKLVIYRLSIDVLLVDDETGMPIRGNIEVRNKKTDEIELFVNENSMGGFTSLRGREYAVSAVSEDYVTQNLDFSTLQISRDSVHYTFTIPLRRINRKGDIIIVHNPGRKKQYFSARDEFTAFDGTREELIEDFAKSHYDLNHVYELSSVYYDFDKYTIRKDAADGLDQLVEVLNVYPNLSVILGSHTDNRGSNEYNDWLAGQRAESVKAYLLKAGVDISRISNQHFGENDLLINCVLHDCEDELHDLNRRTEIYLSATRKTDGIVKE